VRPFERQCLVTVEEIYPTPGCQRSCPTTVETTPKRWGYAAVFACRPEAGIPEKARRALRFRVRVAGGSIGIGLLNADQSKFIERQCLAPASDMQTVFLKIADFRTAGPVVIHTWDTDQAARVHIEDVTMVW
jgi:hypothetical protein